MLDKTDNIFQSTLPRRERPGRSFCPIMLCFISIHAPAKGATLPGKACAASGNISIHAPAKGATSSYAVWYRFLQFQSTLPRRERLYPYSWLSSSYRFQSTLPRRERHGWMPCIHMLHNDFNPRSREGSDCTESVSVQPPAISIHAPAKGATQLRRI